MPWIEKPTRVCRKCGETGGYFYDAPSKASSGKICRTCSKKKRNGRTPDSRPSDTGSDTDGTPTVVRCACGHDYTFRIKNKNAPAWLAKKPCPKCRFGRFGGRKNPEQMPSPEQSEQTPEQSEQTPEEPEEPEQTPEPEPEPDPDADWVAARFDRLPDGLFHSKLPDILDLLDLGIPVWAQGPMGTAKSTLGQQIASALNREFHQTACWPTMPQSALFGFRSPTTGDLQRTPFWDAYEHGGFFMLDEIDNGEPSLTAALNSALSNGHCVFAGNVVVQRHPDFRIMATANTAGLGPENGFIGRLGVDLATRDRFVTVDVQIDEDLEVALAHLYAGNDTTSLAANMRAVAKRRLERRSVRAQQMPSVESIVATVRVIRRLVASRFLGTVVSPRTTIHATQMLAVGFSEGEAFASKLPGLKPSEIEGVLTDANID